MRMRFKPYARPELLACDFHVHEPLTHGGHWHELYARPGQPWHLSLAAARAAFWLRSPGHPDINYLGIDITDKVLILAKRKVEAAYAARGIPRRQCEKLPALTLSASAMPSRRRTVFRASTSISATRGARMRAATSTA